MSFQGLPSVLTSKIAESLDFKDLVRFNRVSKTVNDDVKGNWVKLAQTNLGISKEEFLDKVRKEDRSPSLVYNIIYNDQKDIVRKKIEWVEDILYEDDHDSYDVYRQAKLNYKIEWGDINTSDIESFLDLERKGLSEHKKELYDKVVSKYGKEWIHHDDDDVKTVLRFFYKTSDDEEAFVMGINYPWLTRRFENINKIAEIIEDDDKDLSRYLAGKGIDPSEITPRMGTVAISYIDPPYFFSGIEDENAKLLYYDL